MTTPERAGREGDSQPLPTASDSPYIHDLVAAEIQGLDDPIMLAIAADLEARKTLGIKRYGQPLQAFNGRKFFHCRQRIFQRATSEFHDARSALKLIDRQTRKRRARAARRQGVARARDVIAKDGG